MERLASEAPDLFASLGKDYAKYACGQSFDFDYCDVIANKADVFYQHGEFDVKALITLALLELGISHNRWFVERTFVRMAGQSISDDLAKRIVTEIDVQKLNFVHLIDRLERSIDAQRDNLHPILQQKAKAAN